MLYLNPAIIPDPDAPAAFDAYGRATGPELVVVASAFGWPTAGPTTLTCAFRGTMVDLRADRLAVILASAGLRPLGRMERREASQPHVHWVTWTNELATWIASSIGFEADTLGCSDADVPALTDCIRRAIVAFVPKAEQVAP